MTTTIVSSDTTAIDASDATFSAAVEVAETTQLPVWRDQLRGAVLAIQAAVEAPRAVRWTPTGFVGLDIITGGLRPGELVVVAGRPGMGKTTFALNLAANAARIGGGTVAVFSLEDMETKHINIRLLSAEARVDRERLRTGHLDASDIDRLLHGVKALNGLHLVIDAPGALTVQMLREKCLDAVGKEGAPPLSLVMVDYLQLMTRRDRWASRKDGISELVRELKGLAKELQVPIVVLSQLGRSVEDRLDKRPRLSDLPKDSEAIEQDADIILLCYREDCYRKGTEDRGLAEVTVAKHRQGRTGTVKLKFFEKWGRFDNIAEGTETTETSAVVPGWPGSTTMTLPSNTDLPASDV